MRTTRTVLTVILVCSATPAIAEYVELKASEITTIEPDDKSASPRILVRWELPAGLDEKIVDAAAIEMVMPGTTEEDLAVWISPVEKAWKAEEVKWSEGWNRAGGDYTAEISSPAIVTARNNGRVRADVYQTVLEQLGGTKANFGFIVVPEADTEAKLSAISANDTGRLVQARLIIAYRDRR